MTFQRLCNYITCGEFNYYSRKLEILIEPLQLYGSTDQTSYRITVYQNKQVIEVVDVTPPLTSKMKYEWKDADECRDKVLLEKNRLYLKYACA